MMEIGKQLYWSVNILGIQGHLHGQVLLSSCIVLALLVAFLFVCKGSGGTLIEIFFQFIVSIAKNQHSGSEWTPFLGTLFLFIFFSNWMGALVPWKFVSIPDSSIAAPTNDINTTVALAFLVSIAYFYAGFKKKGLGYFHHYFEPAFLFPLKVLEDFTKPLSLSFRLFGNILADELVVAVLVSLAPFFVPIPLILLGLFTSAIQALIFTTLAAAYIGEAKE